MENSVPPYTTFVPWWIVIHTALNYDIIFYVFSEESLDNIQLVTPGSIELTDMEQGSTIPHSTVTAKQVLEGLMYVVLM